MPEIFIHPEIRENLYVPGSPKATVSLVGSYHLNQNHNIQDKTETQLLLPPAYVVRREGYSFTLLVCSQGGAVPISHNALQHFPECHGAGGVPISHNALQHFQECHGAVGGGTLPGPAMGGGTLAGGVVPWLGGGGYPARGGGTQVGQQKEYSLHGGRYASCVHAGGLSCC